jgi:hypothetical protein
MKSDTKNDPPGSVPAAVAPTSEKRPEPPLVYRAENMQDHWIVERPRNVGDDRDRMVFTDHRAQYCALKYAYEKFGSARFLQY